MGLFGMNEAELKKYSAELLQRETNLKNRESDINREKSNLEHERELLQSDKSAFEKARTYHLEEVKRVSEQNSSEFSKMESRRQELAKQEAEAKAGFVEKQRDVFKEVVEKRISELDARQKDLNDVAKRIADELAALHSREGEIAQRELAVTEREQKADAGFADKATQLAANAKHQYEVNQEEANRLIKWEDELVKGKTALESAKEQLRCREQSVIDAELKRDAGWTDKRVALEKELHYARQNLQEEIAEIRLAVQRETAQKKELMLADLETETSNLLEKRLSEITAAENKERERIRKDAEDEAMRIRTEIANERMLWTKQQEDARKHLEAERTELEKQKSAVSALRSELEGCKTEFEANERTLERKEQRLEQQWKKRNDELDDTIEVGLEEERKSLAVEKQSFKDENNRLRESLRIQTELAGAFDQLKRQLGEKDPAEILRDLNSKTDELKRLREELSTRPTEEMREKYQNMDSESQRLKARIDDLENQINANATTVSETADLRRKNSELGAENKSLAQKASLFEGAANEAQAELNRLRAAYERPAEVAARYKEIEMPHIKADKAKQPTKADIDEITWLKGVCKACDGYGFHFNPRILKAFHTALKIADWSQLTVLAGVSGTGKSELPRLYSHFGGLMFEPLSVQPNWDSQESMLGFFNSIDNKFDAQPVLRFLAQSQQSGNETYEKRIARWKKMSGNKLELDSEKNKELIEAMKESDYPGLEDCVCMVLLDEMNIAYPELYFAEFLSKLELRRGMKGEVPCLPVKIGAGMPPYQLPLGRNILWTGTMNQDETTKSLSDKVLDRSIIIHFPRPTKLIRRQKQEVLSEKNRGTILHRSAWEKWCLREISFSEEDIKPFKQFIEKMNTALAVAGRAIGHRVWQSVEYYMANHPDVRSAQEANDKDALAKALHIAFEDQLVQKVMPKLRGIDTRDRCKSKTECLDKILAQINIGICDKDGKPCDKPFNLEVDFKLACELGYGQFIWQSANYLEDEPVSEKDEVVMPDEEHADKTHPKKTKKSTNK